jgi:hypothetical protein
MTPSAAPCEPHAGPPFIFTRAEGGRPSLTLDMPIRRPESEKFIVDDRIEAIRLVRSLNDGVIKQAAESVKAEMLRRRVDYVESGTGRVVGELRGGTKPSPAALPAPATVRARRSAQALGAGAG